MLRKLVHFLAGFALWCVFAYYWHIVASRPLNPYTRVALNAIGLMIAATTVLIIFWIIHNLNIHRKLQRRKRRRTIEDDRDKDYLGRFLIFDNREKLKESSYIEIELKGREKVFRTSKPIPPR